MSGGVDSTYLCLRFLNKAHLHALRVNDYSVLAQRVGPRPFGLLGAKREHSSDLRVGVKAPKSAIRVFSVSDLE